MNIRDMSPMQRLTYRELRAEEMKENHSETQEKKGRDKREGEREEICRLEKVRDEKDIEGKRLTEEFTEVRGIKLQEEPMEVDIGRISGVKIREPLKEMDQNVPQSGKEEMAER